MTQLFWSRVAFYCVFFTIACNGVLLKSKEKINETKMDKGCLVRDGRDGVPGPPGSPGVPGRDGRDCMMKWSLNKVFEMEKQLHELSSKCQYAAKEVVDVKMELGTTKEQARKLLTILAEKKIVDIDDFPVEKVYMDDTNHIHDIYDLKSTITTLEPATSIPTITTTIKRTEQKADCKKQLMFHTHHTVETRGAVGIEVFQIEQRTFLAVSNFHVSEDGFKTSSFIYRMNPTTCRFEMYQRLPTIGCRSMTFFSDGKESYLVTANHYDGRTHELDSFIFKWNGSEFVNYTSVKTYGASKSAFFNINGENFLVFANYRNNTGISTSVVYKWLRGKLEVFQNLATKGAVDVKFYRSNDGKLFLVFAIRSLRSDVLSEVYVWNGSRFIFLQNVKASEAQGVDMFESEAGLFLAVASYRVANSWYSNSNIFRWNGTAFTLFQEIETSAAIKIGHFFYNDRLHLIIANYYDETTKFETHSMVYRYDPKQNLFTKFQSLTTIGAYDLQPFSYDGDLYLAAAFRFDGKSGTLKSKIYKMYYGCVDKENVLP